MQQLFVNCPAAPSFDEFGSHVLAAFEHGTPVKLSGVKEGVHVDLRLKVQRVAWSRLGHARIIEFSGVDLDERVVYMAEFNSLNDVAPIEVKRYFDQPVGFRE